MELAKAVISERSFRTISVDVPITAVTTLEASLIAHIDELLPLANEHRCYNLEVRYLKDEDPVGHRRIVYALSGYDLKNGIERTILGHPAGYPKGPWGIVAGLLDKYAANAVRMTLIELE